MERALSLLSAIVLFTSLTVGCVSEETRNPNLDIQVTDASRSEGACFGDGDQVACHTFEVRFTNQNEEENVSVVEDRWKAKLEDGSTVSPEIGSGPTWVETGETVDLTLRFELETESTVEVLQYQNPWMSSPINTTVDS